MPKLPFKIGADPEFSFVNNNTRYSAYEIISRFCKDRKEFRTDGRTMGYQINEAGTLGWDGHAPSGEIRPKENSDPKEVTKNIGELLREAHKCMPQAEIKTTSLWMSIGGHIHLEAKEYANKSQKHQKLLQRALASLALPLLANENPINVEIRREKGTGYGDILDARVNGITYEFRPLTAEWITTPEICNATLAYLGVVWNEIYNHPERIEQIAEIIAKTDQQARALQVIIVDEYGALSEGLINRIKKHVRTFELYEQFKNECELIFDTKRVKALKEKVDFDAVKGWKFKNDKTQTMPKIKDILDEKQTKERLKNINLDEIMNYLQIFWANERNMEKVARKIGDTAIAWNWSMEHRYFLTSLPKGIPSPIAINGKGEFLTGTEMIKTKADHEVIKQLMQTAKHQFEQREEFKRTCINLKEGKTETDEHRSIVIGVPYKTREENEGIEEILTMIYKNELKAIKPSLLENVKDLDLPIEHAEYKEGFIITMIKQNENTEKPPEGMTTQTTPETERTILDRAVNTVIEEINQETLTMAEMAALMEEVTNPNTPI